MDTEQLILFAMLKNKGNIDPSQYYPKQEVDAMMEAYEEEVDNILALQSQY